LIGNCLVYSLSLWAKLGFKMIIIKTKNFPYIHCVNEFDNCIIDFTPVKGEMDLILLYSGWLRVKPKAFWLEKMRGDVAIYNGGLLIKE